MIPSTTAMGVSTPTIKFNHAFAEEFPNSNRTHKVESSISNQYVRDFLPVNGNIADGGSVGDSYLEYIVPPNNLELMDLDSLSLEMKIKVVKQDGSDVDDTSKFTVIDGLGHRIFSRCTIYLNGTPCSNNAFFGLYNTIRSYLNMSKDALPGVGRNAFYKDLNTPIDSTITDATFANLNSEEKSIFDDTKKVINFTSPLNLDIGNSDFYLLNGVEVRIRIELSSPQLIINSSESEKYNYKILSAKLWAQKIVPHNSALISLNKSLTNNHAMIEYIFERPVTKNYVFQKGQSILSLDNVFTGIVPQKMYMFFISQSAINGSYSRNASYLSDCSVGSVRLEINGNTFSSLNVSFPSEVSNLFHHTLTNSKTDCNLLTLQLFRKGRTIYSWDLRSSEVDDVLQVERSGNARISVQTVKPLPKNMIVYVIGLINGLIEIDGLRRVKASYLL